MSLTSTVSLGISGEHASTLDLGTAKLSLNWAQKIELANGSGANQADKLFSDRRQLAASASENLDLAGALTDAFGTTLTFTKIKAIAIKALSSNINDVLVGGAASNAFVSWVGDATDVVKVKPGGLLLIAAPDVNGLAVTAGTGDVLKIANSGAGSVVDYEIVIVGT